MQGYRFRLEKLSGYICFWRCVRKNCNARCKTDSATIYLLHGTFSHNHDKEHQRALERRRLRQKCKRKAAELPVVRPSKIILTEMEHRTSEPCVLLPTDLRAVRQAMYRERRKVLPKKTVFWSHEIAKPIPDLSTSREDKCEAPNDFSVESGSKHTVQCTNNALQFAP